MSLYTEFDHYNLPIGADGTPFEYLEALRDEGELTDTSIGWSPAHGGFWVVTGYEAARTIVMNSTDFSNDGVVFPDYGLGDAKLMLAGQDDPDHKKYRRLVQGPFSAAKVGEFEASLRASTSGLIDAFIDEGEVDIVARLGEEVPARLTAIILGLPPEDGDRYRKWTHAMASLFQTDPEAALPIIQEMHDYFDEMLGDRRLNLGDDILSLIMEAKLDGETLTYQEIKDFWIVLLVGGIDNTAKLLGTATWRLAWDKELRRRLVRHPELLPSATAEMIRYYTPGMVGRRVLNEITVGGVTMEPGQYLIMAHSAVNRDSRMFPNPDVFVPDRSPNKHLGLGLGIHRCLGAHLVQLEARIVFEELLSRIPEFELDPTKPSVWQQGQVAGMGEVHLVFPSGGRAPKAPEPASAAAV